MREKRYGGVIEDGSDEELRDAAQRRLVRQRCAAQYAAAATVLLSSGNWRCLALPPDSSGSAYAQV